MKVSFELIEELCTNVVAFYTVRLGDNEARPTEYEEFRTRMKINSANRFDLQELEAFMRNRIGKDGAISKHFKAQRVVERIRQRTPDEFDRDAPDPKDYGLRLYCYRFSEQIVILFNGDRKWYSAAQDCENCEPHFTRGDQIATAIRNAQDKGFIYPEGFDIVYNDPEEIDDDTELFEVTI